MIKKQKWNKTDEMTEDIQSLRHLNKVHIVYVLWPMRFCGRGFWKHVEGGGAYFVFSKAKPLKTPAQAGTLEKSTSCLK